MIECQGKCPNCKSEDITYGDSLLEGDNIGYHGVCNKCGQKFVEWYSLTYVETIKK